MREEEEEEDEEEDEEDSKLIARAQKKSIKCCLKGGTRKDFFWVFSFFFWVVKIGKKLVVKNKCELSCTSCSLGWALRIIALRDPAFVYLDLYREALGLRLSLSRLNAQAFFFAREEKSSSTPFGSQGGVFFSLDLSV